MFPQQPVQFIKPLVSEILILSIFGTFRARNLSILPFTSFLKMLNASPAERFWTSKSILGWRRPKDKSVKHPAHLKNDLEDADEFYVQPLQSHGSVEMSTQR